MQGMLFLGTIISEFFEGLGFPLICIGLVYLIFANRKSHETKKEFVEYYEWEKNTEKGFRFRASKKLVKKK